MKFFFAAVLLLSLAIAIRALDVPLGGLPAVGGPVQGIANGLNPGQVLSGAGNPIPGVGINPGQPSIGAEECQSLCLKQIINCKEGTCAAIAAAGQAQQACLSAYESLKVKICADLCVQVSAGASG